MTMCTMSSSIWVVDAEGNRQTSAMLTITFNDIEIEYILQQPIDEISSLHWNLKR